MDLETAPAGLGDVVIYEVIDRHIAVVTLNRPAVRNAISVEVAEALYHLVAHTERDGDIRVCILASSNPRAFCAGADLGEVAAGRSGRLRVGEAGFAGFVFAQRRKPWIAEVGGFALAGGLELTLACDMVVADEAARFGLPEVKRGLYAGAGGVLRLPRALPRMIANEMLATGEPIDAARAAAFGLVNRVVPTAGLRDASLALARSIAANAPLSVMESLRVARLAAGHYDPALRDANHAAGEHVIASPNAKEGARAFLEKRTPAWVPLG